MQRQGSIKNSQNTHQRPLTCKPVNKIGQEQSINLYSPKNNLKDSYLRNKSNDNGQLRDSELNNVNEQQKKQTPPPLFKYKPKFIAKHFDPFQEFEQKQQQEKSFIMIDAPTMPERSGSQPSLNSMNNSHKFKKLSSKDLNMLSPIQKPEILNEKNVFFELTKDQQDNQTQDQTNDQENKIEASQNENIENKEREYEEERKQKYINQRIRPHTAAIMKAPPIKNIFDTAKVYEQYQKSEIGPQFGDDGQIKQYSVLGKPEWYLKQQKEFNKKSKNYNHDQSLNIDNRLGSGDSKSIISDKLEKDGSLAHIKQINIIGSRTALGGNAGVPKVISMNNFTVTMNHIPNQKKKNKGDTDLFVQELDKEDVQQCIDKVLSRVQSNKEFVKQQNQQQISKFKKGDQLYLTKEQRILQQFDDVQKKQEKLIEHNCKTVGKKFENSVFLRDGEARSKIEVKQVLEMVKTDFEKFGAQNFWQQRLRKDKEDRVLAVEAIQQLVKEDNPMEFRPKNQFDSQKKVKIVEQIRKPQSSKLRTDKQNELPFHSYKSHDYLQEKLLDRKQFINEIARIDNKEIENIEIVGKNVLRSEIEALRNNSSEKSYIMKIRQQKANAGQIQTPQIEENAKQKQNQNRSPRNRNIYDKPGGQTSKQPRPFSPKQPTYTNLRSVVKIQVIPEKEAMEIFLEKEQNLQNQEEEIIEEKYIPFEMRRGGYVQQQIKLHH